MNIYALQAVTKRYPGQPQPANDAISLTIHAGEIFGLLGDNGAGKSTLVKQMMNLERSSSGTIAFYGRPLQEEPLRLTMQIGYMPQSHQAINQLTVGEAIYFTAHLRGLTRRDALAERDRLLALWEIGPLRHKAAGKLSGGESRLLQLAIAMAGAPPVLLLDEPTNELSPQRRKAVWEQLRRLNQEQGTTIIFITHDAIEAEKIIQRVGILYQGRLVALGRPSDLKKQIDQQLRLELFFNEQNTPTLPAELIPHRLAEGRWLLYLAREQVDSVLATLNLQAIDDFRLYSATLEDLYLHYALVDNHPTGA